jgi:hypothetical protein
LDGEGREGKGREGIYDIKGLGRKNYIYFLKCLLCSALGEIYERERELAFGFVISVVVRFKFGVFEKWLGEGKKKKRGGGVEPIQTG